MSQTVTPYLEMSQAIMGAGGEALKRCYQCGTCAGTCPWTLITNFNIRKLVRFGQLGIDGIEEHMWGCSTCKFCVDRCPRGIEIIDVVTAIRNVYSRGDKAYKEYEYPSAKVHIRYLFCFRKWFLQLFILPKRTLHCS